MKTSKESLCDLIERFVRGEDRSREIASRIEVALEDLFAETEPFAGLSHDLAFYSPTSGPYLRTAEDMLPMMAHVLAEIRRQQS
jgi:hypothetical protein